MIERLPFGKMGATPGRVKGLNALLVELAFAADGAVPTELRVFKAGKNASMKGEFLFDEKAAKSVMASAEKRGVDFPFDYNHGSTSALGMLNPEMSGKAAAWCSLAIRDGELWATNIRWNEKALSAIQAKEWRYVSPTFTHDKDNRVREMLCIALTNTPALYDIPAIVAASAAEEETHVMEKLLAQLGLAVTATEAEAVAALTAIVSKLTAAETKIVELAAQIASMTAAAETAQLNALLEQGQKDGKIPPSLVETLRPLGVKGLTAYLEKAPKIVGGVATPEPEGDPKRGVAGLSAVEVENCKKLHIDPAKYAEHKAKLTAAAS